MILAWTAEKKNLPGTREEKKKVKMIFKKNPEFVSLYLKTMYN